MSYAVFIYNTTYGFRQSEQIGATSVQANQIRNTETHKLPYLTYGLKEYGTMRTALDCCTTTETSEYSVTLTFICGFLNNGDKRKLR